MGGSRAPCTLRLSVALEKYTGWGGSHKIFLSIQDFFFVKNVSRDRFPTYYKSIAIGSVSACCTELYSLVAATGANKELP